MLEKRSLWRRLRRILLFVRWRPCVHAGRGSCWDSIFPALICVALICAARISVMRFFCGRTLAGRVCLAPIFGGHKLLMLSFLAQICAGLIFAALSRFSRIGVARVCRARSFRGALTCLFVPPGAAPEEIIGRFFEQKVCHCCCAFCWRWFFCWAHERPFVRACGA